MLRSADQSCDCPRRLFEAHSLLNTFDVSRINNHALKTEIYRQYARHVTCPRAYLCFSEEKTYEEGVCCAVIASSDHLVSASLTFCSSERIFSA